MCYIISEKKTKQKHQVIHLSKTCMMVMSFSVSSSVSSPALLESGMSHFFSTMLAYLNTKTISNEFSSLINQILKISCTNLRPIPLMEVSANMTLVFPSMLVLRTRKMCWKLGGTTRDMVAFLAFYLKQLHSFYLFSDWLEGRSKHIVTSRVFKGTMRFQRHVTRSPQSESWRWGWSP